VNDQLLREADIVLSKCGRPQAVAGRSIVPLDFGILVQGQCANNQTTTLTQEIPGNMPFVLESIQATFPGSLYFNIQLPNGRFLLSAEQDVSQFAGIGSYRYLLPKPIECPPGSRIVVTMDTSVTAGGTQNLQLLFEGAYMPAVRGSRPACYEDVASDLARYWGGQQNQNILAPGYMGGYGIGTPANCKDEIFTYSSLGNGVVSGGAVIPGFTISVAGGPYSGTDEIDIEESSDFLARAVQFSVSATGSAVGTYLVRIRDGSGYALMDDYFDAAKLIPNSPFGTPWKLRAGAKVFMDLQLVDFAGAGLFTIQTFLDGVKRKRKL
jgi:hypothetical protein